MTSKVTGDKYAQQWCNAMIRDEVGNCNSGVKFATEQIKNGVTPSDITNKCTMWGVQDIPTNMPKEYATYAATEGFRYGCYLTTMFNGDKTNLCSVPLIDKFNSDSDSDSKNKTAPKIVNMPYVCPKSCSNLFSSSKDQNKCVEQAQTIYNKMLIDNNGCTNALGFSCVEKLNDHNLSDVVGCTMGQIQSHMLYYAKKNNTDTNADISCVNISGNSNGNGYQVGTVNSMNGQMDTGGDMFPYGSTYDKSYNPKSTPSPSPSPPLQPQPQQPTPSKSSPEPFKRHK